MRILIIGSKGFIGHNLNTFLSGKGHDLWGADVVTDYVNKAKYFVIDVSNSDYYTVFQQVTFDICINCSGAASVPDSLSNPLRDYFLNTVNVFKILDAIRQFQPTCKFINLSSAAVYGNPVRLPIHETDKPNLISPYGYHKLQSELVCNEFHDLYGIKTCSLRIFSAYGEGLQKQLFWDLYKKAKSGLAFTLYGTGNESRDFIHILDLVQAMELVAESAAFEAEVINIANGQEIKIKDAASIFFSFFNTDIDYSFSGEGRSGDPVNWLADISKLSGLGYNTSVNIETGLYLYFNWIASSEPTSLQ